jgi:hypothetical protein
VVAIAARAEAEVTGAYYDWQKTMKPETPWVHDYSQTLVMKIGLVSEDSNGRHRTVRFKFEDALDVIRRLDNLTLGIPKIVYLVGWQSTRFPDWSGVEESLKRPQDKTALESLKWLMAQAREYHTTVSLHVNMFDIDAMSSLWKPYLEKDVIVKDRSGAPLMGPMMDGVRVYQVSYAQEWKLGLVQKQIDDLLVMLPQLKDAGTIHIDAFHTIPYLAPKHPLSRAFSGLKDPATNPYLGTTVEDEMAAQRKIFRYWRQKGIDATAETAYEQLRIDPFIGLQPMAWLQYSIDDLEKYQWLNKPASFRRLPLTLLAGTPMMAEQEINRDPIHLPGLIEQFCTKVVPWYYRNNKQPKEAGFKPDNSNGNVFLPALWSPWTLVAYSKKGYVGKNLVLPKSWRGLELVEIEEITVDGLKSFDIVPVKTGALTLTLKPGQAVVIEQ